MYVVLAVCEKYTYLQTIICTHLVNPFYSYKGNVFIRLQSNYFGEVAMFNF